MSADPIDSWIREYLEPRFPELVAPYTEARALSHSAQTTGRLSPEALDILVRYAKDPRRSLSENVATELGILADRFASAKDAIMDLSRDGKLHVRINALVALSSHALTPVHETVLRERLKDRSTRVRLLAADKIMGFGLKSLLPDLEAAVIAEAKPEVRTSLEWERDLLRDGHRVKNLDGGRVDVTVRRGRSVISCSYPRETFEAKGLNGILQELRRGG